MLDISNNILKSREWFLMLVFSGVLERENYFPKSERLFRKGTYFSFINIDYYVEVKVTAKIVGSQAWHSHLPAI